MGIMARCRNAALIRSRTSRAMKPGMGVAMWAMRGMSLPTSTALDLQVADGRAAVVIPVVDIRGKLMVL